MQRLIVDSIHELLAGFKDPEQGRHLLSHIKTMANEVSFQLQRPVQIMEVCGGHTHSIFRYGLNRLLPDSLEFVHGPGCPVCVLPKARIDISIKIAQQPDVIFTSFGDALRVPGSSLSLADARAQGADVRIVYSPMDALKLAQQNPQKQVVFFALGFETTMPATAFTVLAAEQQHINNFSVFCNHITIVPVLNALLQQCDVIIDGFIAPGHVSTIIGSTPYNALCKQYQKPFVVTGFEPNDILQSVHMLLMQLQRRECKVENQYLRGVNAEGNVRALHAIHTVFEDRERFEWRGLGDIEKSGVQLKPAFHKYDAEHRFEISSIRTEVEMLPCGDVLKGKLKPWQCPLFAKQCHPQQPAGALMVSSEGACAAYYQFADQYA